MNFFDPRTAAERFARGRPFFHPLVIKRVGEYLGLTAGVTSALDIGCGTGLSSAALSEIAETVTAVDISEGMLSFAPKTKGVNYAVSKAEVLPFPAGQFEIITMSQVFHWLDRKVFLAEAGRVLKKDGFLVVYDNYISDEMTTNPKYQPWFREVFLARYPTPPRNWPSFLPEDMEEDGFSMICHDVIENTISFSLNKFVDFLLTLTNVIAAVEGGREDVSETRKWLTGNLRSFFTPGSDEKLTFTAPIWILTPCD
jgi:SAM-dependent methyltransferase